MRVVLYHPQIPQNTGNIVRTCKVTGTDLVLVHPLGFSIDDRSLKRAGLDYWDGVNVIEIKDLISYLHSLSPPLYFFSSRAKKMYTDVGYTKDCTLIFGSESAGLPDEYRDLWPENFVTLPMKPNSRCLNLSTAVGIGIYEALRQSGSLRSTAL